MTVTIENSHNNDDDIGYLSWLEYRETDQENSGARTILINGVPDWAIRLKLNKYYNRKVLKALVCGCCHRNKLDYISLENVTNCVREILPKVNGYDYNNNEKYEDEDNEDNDNSPPVLSVSSALRRHSGKVKTLAMIVGISQPYKVVTSIEWTCPECGYQEYEDLEPPSQFFNSPHKKCPVCRISSNSSNGNGEKQEQQKQKQIDLIALPEHENAKSISVQDSEPNDDLEKLHVVLLGDKMTRNVRAGELAVITGFIHVLSAGVSNKGGGGNNSAKLFPVLYAESMEYQREKDKPITYQDIEAFKRFAQKPDLINRLVSMFAPNVIGHSDKKVGILRSAVNAKNNIRTNSTAAIRRRIHSLLVGDPGAAKTMLAKEATKIVPNSRYVTAQHASPKSILAIVDKEQDNKMLLLGAVPMSKNAICSINELGSKAYEDQQYLADVMEEGKFTIDKHGIYQEIDSPTTIIATANPHGGYWDDSLNPGIDEIPIKNNILDRFDQIYIFKNFQTTEERREYAKQKMEMNQRGIAYNYNFLKRYILYAGTSLKEPQMTPEASGMLTEFWMRLMSNGTGRAAANRNLDSLVRIAKAQATLHLREEVDVEIANEVIQSVGLMLAEFGRAVDTTIVDPRDLAYNEIIEYINSLDYPITFIEAAKHVCANNNAIKQYLGDRLSSIAENKRLRDLHNRFTDRIGTSNNKRSRSGLSVAVIRMSPLTLVRAGKLEEQQELTDRSKRSDRSSSGEIIRGESNSTTNLRAIDSIDPIDRAPKGYSKSEEKENIIEITEDMQLQLNHAIQKAVLDRDGVTSKGYFTLSDLAFELFMLPMTTWNYAKIEQALNQLLQDGKLQEIEPRKRYKPCTEKPNLTEEGP